MRRVATIIALIGIISGFVWLRSLHLKRSEDSSPHPRLLNTVHSVSPAEGDHVSDIPAGEDGTFRPEEAIIGSPDAKLKIEACTPFQCQQRTIELLTKLGKSHPDKIRVELFDMNSEEGRRVLDKYNKGCATIFFNGKMHFKIMKDGKEEEVIFTQAEGGLYQPEDIIPVARQLLVELYGPDGVPDPLIAKDELPSEAEGKEKGEVEQAKDVPRSDG